MNAITERISYLRSNVSCIPWDERELALLLEVAPLLGRNWERASRLYFPRRSPNQLKCKYNYLARRAAGRPAEKKQERRAESDTQPGYELDFIQDWLEEQ